MMRKRENVIIFTRILLLKANIEHINIEHYAKHEYFHGIGHYKFTLVFQYSIISEFLSY